MYNLEQRSVCCAVVCGLRIVIDVELGSLDLGFGAYGLTQASLPNPKTEVLKTPLTGVNV